VELESKFLYRICVISDQEERTPRKRVAAPVTQGRTLTKVNSRDGRDGRGRAQAKVSASGVAPSPVGARVTALGDPRIEGIMRALEMLGNLIG